MNIKKIMAALCAVSMCSGAAAIPASSAGAISTPLTGTAELDLGDVNGDKAIDAKDASEILEEYSFVSTGAGSKFSAAQQKAGDVNNSGSVDSVDASIVLAYYSFTSTGGVMEFADFVLKETGQQPQATTTTTAATTSKTTTTTAKTTKTTSSTTKTTTTKPKTTTTTSAATTTTTSTTTTTTKATTTTTVTTVDPDHVSSIKLNKTTLDINVGEGGLAAYVTMFPTTAKNKAELWSSDNEAVAIVNEEGWVTGISEGECTITVKSADNPKVKAEVRVTVTDTTKVKDIRLSRYEMTLEAGTGDLSANVTMLPTTAKDKGEIWSSDNEAVAYSDDQGWVVGVAPGTCTITVRSSSNPEVKAEIKVTVYSKNVPAVDRVSEIKLSVTDIELKLGERGISYVTMLPESAPNKGEIWKSSDESIAVVDSYGNITAMRAGTCVVTVTSADNPSVSADVNVTVIDPNKVTKIILTKYEMEIPLGTVDISYVTMLPESAPNKGEIWVCSDETIASVDKDGWIYGRRLGECTVTVYSQNDPSVKAEIKVKIVDPNAAPQPSKLYSFISDRLNDDSKFGFVTLLPEDRRGRYVIDYIIEDSNGVVTTVTSQTILIPEMNSVISGITADTDTFTVTSYVTNLSSTVRARIGVYRFSKSAGSVTILNEDIENAFEYVNTNNG